MTKHSYVAFDQHGNTHHIGRNPPRKWLLTHLQRKHADMMYIDLTTGKTRHIGYIVAGLWCEVFKIIRFKGEE